MNNGKNCQTKNFSKKQLAAKKAFEALIKKIVDSFIKSYSEQILVVNFRRKKWQLTSKIFWVGIGAKWMSKKFSKLT